MTPVLRARGLRHSFGSGARSLTVLDGADLSVGAGEVVGLVGPNGSGKTTALRILSRALVPDEGTVALDGRDLGSYTGRERARLIAVMAQESPGEVPLTVADTVLLGRVPHRGVLGSTTDADLAIAAEALEQVGALHLARKELGLLSGGERQRVLAARSFAQRPRVLLMDEPTNHLDIGAQHQLLQLVRSHGAATVVVLHDLNLAARCCDRVVMLEHGRVLADGPPEEILTEELVGEVYGVRAERRTADDGTMQLLFRHPSPDAHRTALAEEISHAR